MNKVENKKYKVTGTNIDSNGLKTIITVTTDDVNVVKQILDNKNTINAEFKEVNKKTKTNSKSKIKTLSAPKKTLSKKKGKANDAKKNN